MLTTVAPSAWATGTRHEQTGCPSISTVQAPHSPSPQPSFVPVRPRSLRSTSSSRDIGWPSSVTSSPLTRHTTFVPASATHGSLRRLCAAIGHEELHERLRRQRKPDRIQAGRLRDGVENRGRGTIHRQLAYPLRAGRPVLVRPLLEVHADRRKIHRRGHDVVGHLRIDHAALSPYNLLVECPPYSLRHASFDLPCRQNGVDHFPDLLDRDEVVYARLERPQIDADLRDVHAPRVGPVRVTLIALVVPSLSRGRPILRGRFQRPAARDVSAAGR